MKNAIMRPTITRMLLTNLALLYLTQYGQAQSNAKDATSFTKKTQDAVRAYLPFADKTGYDNARKGFIASIDAGEIKDEKGNVVYRMKQYDFIKGQVHATTNPSLWRQSEINSINIVIYDCTGASLKF